MKDSFKKIIKSFELSIKNYDSDYKSKHWLLAYNKKKDFFRFKNLKNFRSNSLSYGLDIRPGSLAYQRKNFEDLKKKVSIKFIEENLFKENIGNLKNCIKLNGKILDPNSLFQMYAINLLKKNIKEEIKFICEIGAGFGCLSRLLIKNFPKSKIFIIDLPEANYLSSYFLLKHFPEKKIIMYSDITNNEISLKQINEYDIFILPPWVKISKIKVNIFINVRSFMEMNKNIIKRYFDLIQENITEEGLFLNINRYDKRSVGESIRLFEYPYDDKWKVIKSEISWSHSNVHTLITKRDNFISDIREELNKIEKITHKNNLILNKHLIKKILPVKLFLFFQRIKHLISNYLNK